MVYMFKINEHIHIALVIKSIGKYRSKDSKCFYLVLPAKVYDAL